MTLTAKMNTERSTRKAAKNEKEWLDFAVRELSRVVAGKEKGQEIWNNKCKPLVWDEEVKSITNSYDVRLAWKNPTTNPKDRKEDLRIKCKILSKMLRAENKFPRDLEEEAELWESGRFKELLQLSRVVSVISNIDSTLAKIHSAFDLTDESLLKHPNILNYIKRNEISITKTAKCCYKLLKVLDNSTRNRSDCDENFDLLTTAHNNLVKETSEPEIGNCNNPSKLNVSKNCKKRNSLEAENVLPKRPRLENFHQNMNASVVGGHEKVSSNIFDDLRGYQSGRMTSINQTLEQNNNSANNFLNDTDMSITVVDFQSTTNKLNTTEQIRQDISTHSQPLQDKIVFGTSLQENSLPVSCSSSSIDQTFSPQFLSSSDYLTSSPSTNQSLSDCSELLEDLTRSSSISPDNFSNLINYIINDSIDDIGTDTELEATFKTEFHEK
ncbi:uncharacterized protein LOC131952524 [Physella acuta]|uniref:uncharacterized protein LOC131952524 n=1 Tax=Physella acuta TaxID=109671 RepID=UPI0027DD3B20|nr:uncharacterized protein LOC131952524 [Physella acuta]